MEKIILNPILRWNGQRLFCGQVCMGEIAETTKNGMRVVNAAFARQMHYIQTGLVKKNYWECDVPVDDPKAFTELMTTEVLSQLATSLSISCRPSYSQQLKFYIVTTNGIVRCGTKILARIDDIQNGIVRLEYAEFPYWLRKTAGKKWVGDKMIRSDSYSPPQCEIENLYQKVLQKLEFEFLFI